MGLFTNEKDEEGIWNERMIGAPRNTSGFAPQSTWEAITHRKSGTFKTSASKGFHITNHLLKFSQEFIAYNLMGTASSALTTTELYFAWCMSRKIKVHLSYWLAQACHSMTSNPSRHLYTCHLLGAYIQLNFVMKIAKAGPKVLMCEAPKLFSVEYFFNKNLLYMDGEVTCFYEIGRLDGVVKREPEEVDVSTAVDSEELRREMLEVRKDIGEVRMEVQALKGSIDKLAERSSAQNDRMTVAVKLMQKMAEWLEKKFSQTQRRIQPRPGILTAPPGQGSSSVQKPASVSKLVAPMSVRKPVTKEVPEEEGSASSARKKVKMNRPIVLHRSGSRGGQTQN